MSAVKLRHRAATVATLALTSGLLGVAGTSAASTDPPAPSIAKVTSSVALKRAVYSYSKAFLGDNPVKAYKLLTPRCREKVSLSYFTGIVTAAGDMYGPQPIRSYGATMKRNRARATYRYRLHELDQVREPWRRIGGAWKNDDC